MTGEKKGIFASLKKRLPGGLRESKESSVPKLEKLVKSKNKNKRDEDDDEAGTDTVATGQGPIEQKFAVQATSKNEPAKGSVIPENEAPRLIYLTSYGSKVVYPLIWEETLIGRKDDNQIVLTDATISKCHCSIFRKPDGYIFYNF